MAVVPTVGGLPAAMSASPRVTAPALGSVAVADSGGPSVLVYAPNANSSSPPAITIAGSSTGLTSPYDISWDPAGDIWVSDSGRILEFAAGASGNVAPKATIAGTNTGLSSSAMVTPLTVDPSGAVWIYDSDAAKVFRFNSGHTGNRHPDATITPPYAVNDIAASKDGKVVWLVDGFATAFSYRTTATSSAKPVSTLGLGDPTEVAATGVAVDGFGHLRVTDNYAKLYDFAPDKNGQFPSGVHSRSPVATVAGDDTGMSSYTYSPAVAANDDVWVASEVGGQMTRIVAGATGDAQPRTLIQADGTNAVSFTGVDVYGRPPAAPSHLAATLKSSKVTLTWKAPSHASGELVFYRVESAAKRTGSYKLVKNTVATSLPIPAPTGSHRYYRVTALTPFGSSLASAVLAGPGRPSAPRAAHASAISGGLTLTWKAPRFIGSPRLNRYVVDVARCKVGHHGCLATTYPVGASHHSLTVRGLAHKRYYLRVTSHNKLGNGGSSKLLHVTPKR